MKFELSDAPENGEITPSNVPASRWCKGAVGLGAVAGPVILIDVLLSAMFVLRVGLRLLGTPHPGHLFLPSQTAVLHDTFGALQAVTLFCAKFAGMVATTKDYVFVLSQFCYITISNYKSYFHHCYSNVTLIPSFQERCCDTRSFKFRTRSFYVISGHFLLCTVV